MDGLIFLTCAFIAVACAINLVLQTHPISSAISLVGVMVSLAVLYLLLGGEFIAMAQIIVYAGAIMVLFTFVIMLLNAGAERNYKRPVWATVVGVPSLFGFLGLVSWFIASRVPAGQQVQFGTWVGGDARSLGRQLFTTYLLPFEITSVLILIAIAGAIVLAQKEID
jgi:NADH-quinone oxidoreductase subunit J